MKPTNDMNAARGKTAATPAATAHPPGLKAPRTAAYRGERIKINSLGGTTTTYIPLMYLAAEWSLDYRTLRNFVRDNTNIPTEKQAFHHDFRGQKTDFIVIREADLLRLYHRLHLLSGTEAVRPVSPPAASDPPGAGRVKNGSGEARTQPPAPEEPHGEST